METTLSRNTYLRMLAQARKLVYRTCLIYVGTESLSVNIARVQARVLKGGHDVPLEDPQRRYSRSFSNLARALTLVDEGVLRDNSTSDGHRIIALKLRAFDFLLVEPLPEWAQFLRS